jgi:predicted Ser/Thr protein kinase
MNPEDCLPEELKRPETTIAKIAAGMSGAGVYRVEASGRTFVLKIASPNGPLEAWKARTRILGLASEAGLAPLLVHVDEEAMARSTRGPHQDSLQYANLHPLVH